MKRYIAIIDDGIISEKCQFSKIVLKLQYNIDKGIIDKREETVKNEISHVTIVARVLETYIKDVTLIDIKVIINNVGSVDGLVKALEWCYKYNIGVINVSLGTINYHDYYKLHPIIQKMIKKGIKIIAAYHNLGIICYPACMKGIIGVQRNKEYNLEVGDFLYEKTDNRLVLTVQGEKIIEMDEMISVGIEFSNSYVAPIITAYVYQMLFQYHILPNKIERYLKKYAKGDIRSNVLMCTNKKKVQEKFPIIEIYAPVNRVFTLTELFEQNGYHVEVIGEELDDNRILPIKMYSYNVGKKIKLYCGSIEDTYNPSCVFIHKSYKNPYKIEDVDLRICWKEERWVVEGKGEFTLRGLYCYITKYY